VERCGAARQAEDRRALDDVRGQLAEAANAFRDARGHQALGQLVQVGLRPKGGVRDAVEHRADQQLAIDQRLVEYGQNLHTITAEQGGDHDVGGVAEEVAQRLLRGVEVAGEPCIELHGIEQALHRIVGVRQAGGDRMHLLRDGNLVCHVCLECPAARLGPGGRIP
jgi:hypothetical protein